ncbi:MAG: bi-domain-containing oxidoreductase [Pseudomonadaceae bacterium]|nr:bi-domain-containing oxidoreductase [Pseudomonadaceae bacterium]
MPKQIIQNLKSGKVEMVEVPTPACGAGEVVVATRASLISAGTERMMMDFAGKSLVGKAKERPDLARKVLAKMNRDGVADTLKGVFLRLDEPLPLGYSAAGEVVAVGRNLANEFKVGDAVAMAGAGLANHAQFNAVPRNLVVPMPKGLPYEHACYATLGAIALHGVRNADVKLGERVLVMGLGLVGQLVTQLCAAAGARVAAVDFNTARCKLAGEGGALWHGTPDAMAKHWQEFTDGRGFDAVLLCAATDSDGPLAQAAEWARDRANVVLVGKVGTRFDYASYMKKELNVRVSRSYGPGRYDPAYEGRGHTYPEGYVPHTERDNLAEVVRLMAAGKLRVDLLTTHTFPLEDALKGYGLVKEGKGLGIVLAYPQAKAQPSIAVATPTLRVKGAVGISFLGCGGFVRSVVLPALKGLKGWNLQQVVSKGGLSAAHVAKRYGAAAVGTDVAALWKDKATHAVFIGTRHNVHAAQAVDALKAGKHVWVEKPLGLTAAEIDKVEKAHTKSGRVLMVGFNRRFSPALVPLKAKLEGVTSPKHILIRVNAGKLEGDNWQNGAEGGGRLLGEVVHFTDMALWLAGSEVSALEIAHGAGQDNYTISLGFADGSLATVIYSSEGDPAAPKERVEVMAGGASGVMDNYQRTTWSHNGYRQTLYKKPWHKGQEKGHAQALAAWLAAIRGEGEAPISPADIFASSRLLVE